MTIIRTKGPFMAKNGWARTRRGFAEDDVILKHSFSANFPIFHQFGEK